MKQTSKNVADTTFKSVVEKRNFAYYKCDTSLGGAGYFFIFVFLFFTYFFISLFLASCSCVAVEELAHVLVCAQILMYFANYLMKWLPSGQT